MVERNELTYPVLYDTTTAVARSWNVYDLLGDGVSAPSMFVFAPAGHLVAAYIGSHAGDRPDAEDILKVARDFMSGPPPEFVKSPPVVPTPTTEPTATSAPEATHALPTPPPPHLDNPPRRPLRARPRRLRLTTRPPPRLDNPPRRPIATRSQRPRPLLPRPRPLTGPPPYRTPPPYRNRPRRRPRLSRSRTMKTRPSLSTFRTPTAAR